MCLNCKHTPDMQTLMLGPSNDGFSDEISSSVQLCCVGMSSGLSALILRKMAEPLDALLNCTKLAQDPSVASASQDLLKRKPHLY